MKRILLIAVAAVVVMLVAYQLQSVATDSGTRATNASRDIATESRRLDSKSVDGKDRTKNDATQGDDYDRNPPDSGISTVAGAGRANLSAHASAEVSDANGRTVRSETNRGVEVGTSRARAQVSPTTIPPVPPAEALQSPAPSVANTTASSLRGLSYAQVQERLGAPTLTYRDLWHYETRAGTLRVYFANGHVTQSVPADFELPALPSRSLTSR